MQRLGNYTIERELARGGMGAVYVARDPTGRRVALKLLLEQHDPTERARFRREAEALGRIAHPGVVSVHGFGQDPRGRDYLVLALIEGESLDDRLKREGPLDPREAAGIARAVADALAAAHAQGVLHRDIKPSNVLLRAEDGAPLVTDFGLARVTDQSQRLTQTGTMHGTPAYMPPEQAAGELNRIGPPSDVYGLGALLFHALTGRPPFQGGSAINLLNQVLTKPAPRASSIAPQVPAALDAIVTCCLQKVPGARYPSAEALRDALDRFLAGEAEPGSRRPLLVALPLLALAIAAGVAVALRDRPGPDLPEPARSSPLALATATPAPSPSTLAAPAPLRGERDLHPAWQKRDARAVGVRFMPDGSLLSWTYHGALGSTVRRTGPERFWRFEGERVYRVAVAGGRVVAIVGPDASLSHPAGKRLVLLLPGGAEKLLRPANKNEVFTAVGLDPDGKWLAVGSYSGNVRKSVVERHRWGANGLLEQALVLTGHEEPVFAVAFADDGSLLSVSGGGVRSRTGRLEAASNHLIQHDPRGRRKGQVPNDSQILSLAVDPGRCAIGDTNQKITLIELPVGKGKRHPPLRDPSLRSATLNTAFAGVSARAAVHQLRLHEDLLFARTFSADDRSRTELRIWSVGKERVVGGITSFAHLHSFDVSRDGQRVALGLRQLVRGKNIEIWPVDRLMGILPRSKRRAP